VVVAEEAGEQALHAAAVVLDQLTGARPRLDAERRTVGAVVLDPTVTLPRVVRELDASGVPLLDATLRPPTLDEVFLRLTVTGHQAQEVAA
jgi:ABC-2 type transport system ATP-binding protein